MNLCLPSCILRPLVFPDAASGPEVQGARGECAAESKQLILALSMFALQELNSELTRSDECLG